MEATDGDVAASVDAAAAVDDTAESTVDDTLAADGDTTESIDDSDSWSPTTCPSCGNGVLMEVVMGPSEAHLAPCGCRVAPGHLQRQRD